MPVNYLKWIMLVISQLLKVELVVVLEQLDQPVRLEQAQPVLLETLERPVLLD
jgi:hypothetical protein